MAYSIYQHVLGEFVAVPPCSITLLLLGVSEPPALLAMLALMLAREARKMGTFCTVPPYISTGGACDLPRSAGNRGSQTEIGFAVERLVKFGFQLVIRSPGTEYYLMKDKADRNTQLFDRSDFSARLRSFYSGQPPEPSTHWLEMPAACA